METNNEAIEFWNEKKEVYRGEIEYKSFCRLLGTTNREGKNQAGLLFRIGQTLVFEDFEKEANIFGLMIKRKTQKYEKTIVEMPLSEIKSVRRVSQRGAASKIAGAEGTVPAISPVTAFFGIIIYEIIMENGEQLYFEIMGKTSAEEITGRSFS